MKLIENYVVCDGNIFFSGRLLSKCELHDLTVKTNHELLEILSQDKDWLVRSGVAENHSAPIDILEVLSQDKDDIVRRYVAWNPSTSINVLNKLSQDEDEYVREGVAQNPSTPTDILEKLVAQDKRKWVKHWARQTLKKKKP